MIGELPVDGLAGDEGAVVDRPEQLVEIRWHVGAGRNLAAGDRAVAVNSVPPSVAISKAAPHAVTALSSGYSTGFLVVAIAALACAVATALFLGGRTGQEEGNRHDRAGGGRQGRLIAGTGPAGPAQATG